MSKFMKSHSAGTGLRRPLALLVVMGMLIPALLAAASPAGAQVAPPTPSEPPIAGHNISVFPSRDYLIATGYPQSTTSATVEIFRGAILTGRVANVLPTDNPATPGFEGDIEINHPGAHCWGPLVGTDGATAVTPNIQGGDVVRVTYTYVDPLGNLVTSADQLTVSRVQITQRPTPIGPDTVELKGIAPDARGRALDITTLTASVFNKADPFDVNGRPRIQAASTPLEGVLAFDTLNNPNGINWTATFTGLSAADVARADGAEASIGENFGLTGFSATELGQADPAGPAGNCVPLPGAPAVAPLDAPVASAVEATGTNYVAATGSLYYPATAIGATGATKSVTIKNIGAGATGQLHITGLATTATAFVNAATSLTTGAAFTYVPTGSTCVGATVAVGASCVINVKFASTSAAYATGTLSIASDSALGVTSVNLRGLAVSTTSDGATTPFLIQQPGSVNMGTRAPGVTSAAATVNVVNLGAAANTSVISAAVVDLVTGANADNAAGDFATAGGSCGSAAAVVSVPSGGRCLLLVKMTPTAGGARRSTLRISNAQNTSALVHRTTALSGTGLTAVSVTEPPTIPWSLGAFPGREFVSLSGAPAGTTYSVQVIRHNEVVSQASNLTPADIPGTPVFDGVIDVNHPAAPCWEKVTPDLRPGDRVRVVNAAGVAVQTYVANVKLYPSPTSNATAAILTAPGTVEFHGRAVDEAGKPYPLTQVGVRLVTSTANPFDLNQRRQINAPGEGTIHYDPISVTNPDGTRFTATFSGLSDADVDRAINQATQRVAWLGRNPALLTEITISEFGAGLEGGCTPMAPDLVQPPLEALTGDATPLPGSLTFAPRSAGTSQSKVLTIRNTGPAPLNISAFTMAGTNATQFTALAAGNTCIGVAIAPESECVVTVTYRSSASVLVDSVRTARLQIIDDVAGLVEVPLSGREVVNQVAYLTANPSDVTFTDTQAGTSTTAAITITNEGQNSAIAAGFSRSVTSTVAGNAGAFSAAGCTTALGTGVANNTCTLTLTFAPPATADYVATANLNYAESAAAGGATGTVSIPMAGRSRITTDGYNDPPINHFFSVLPITDSAQLTGYTANEIVDVEVLRPSAVPGRAATLIATAGGIIPTDNPATQRFDGIVTANFGAGGSCFTPITPDIRPGDIVRATSYDISDPLVTPPVTSREQSYAQDHEITGVAVQSSASTVTVTGRFRDIRTGVVPPAEGLEVRLPARGATFSGARALLSTRFDGTLRVDATTGDWSATFINLTPADITLATQTDPTAVWLGRDLPEAFEATVTEWNQPPGAQLARCAATGLGEISFNGEPALPAVVHNVGVSGIGAGGTPGLGGQSAPVTITNDGNAPLIISGLAFAGFNPGDFKVTGGTCAVGSSVAAGASCTVVVTIAATAVGQRNASLMVTHTGANSPEYAAVRGIGVGSPILNSITPATAGRGIQVTLGGLSLTGVTGVTFGGVPATGVTFVNDTTVTALVPTLPVNTVNPVPVAITTVAGTASLNNVFTYVPDAPTITGLTLPAAPIVAGKTVTVTGTNLAAASTITFGGLAVAKDTTTVAPAAPNGFRVNLDGTLTVTIPAGAPASSAIVVTSTGGTATSAAVAVVQPPTLSASNAVKAQATVGTTVTFTGTNLGIATATTTAPILPIGSLAGVSPATPAVSSVTFTGATAAGVTVASAAITRLSGTTIRLVVPAGALPGPIRVTGPAGSTIFNGLLVLAAPVVTATQGTAVTAVLGTAPVGAANQTAIGKTVTITGAGFVGVTGITIGAARVATFTVVSGTSITAVVPAGTPNGAAAIAVTTAGGTGTVAVAARPTVVPAPTVTSFTPLTALRGAAVTVTGGNLQYATELRLAGTAVAFTRVGTGATQTLRFTIPLGGLSGSIQALTLAGTGTSVQALRITG